jgi:LysR family hca operon transcriptional activator
MDLRHLRYFVAVAERGSVLAAAQQLNTSQPSLSRQIRDLEAEVGVKLLDRQARGVSLTEAGKVFLDHARLAISQAEAALQGARQIGRSERPTFKLGFLASREPWIPYILRVLRDEAPNIEIRLSSHSSPELAFALKRGDLDAAILRRENYVPGLNFKSLCEEPLVAMLPADHRLASKDKITAKDLASEVYVGSSNAAPVLEMILKSYASINGVEIVPRFEAGSLSAAISMVVSTGGITLIPLQAQSLLTSNVVARPLEDAPTMELCIGYSELNSSQLLRRLLNRWEGIAERFQPGDEIDLSGMSGR